MISDLRVGTLRVFVNLPSGRKRGEQMTYSRKILISAAAVLAVIAVGCGAKQEPAAETQAATTEPAPEPSPMVAVAELEAREGLGITGRVTFTEPAPGEPVMVSARVEGGTEGRHGFHVHEVGDCSAEDFTSAGGHFNPTGVPHGGPDDMERHGGDLGNIAIGADGTGELQLTSDMLTVADGPSSVVGRAVILHEGEDDLVSQPTGAAGSRLACGVIRRDG
jgi:Cu-Zn family superoxide dismutase